VPPRPQPRELTLPLPYKLRSEARHAEAVQRRGKEVAREEEERRRAAEFRVGFRVDLVLMTQPALCVWMVLLLPMMMI